MPRSRPEAERLWEKVEIRGPDDCWPWLGALLPVPPQSRRPEEVLGRYGWFNRGKAEGYKKEPAHRTAFRLTFGDFDPELDVLHRCDRPGCMNPRHLFAGGPVENIEDAVRKGRHGKLALDAVRAIRLSPELPRVLAGRYGVCDGTIRNVQARRTYAVVP